MSEKRGKKRPKSYYLKCAAGGKKFKKANDLAAGMKGFLVTCNKYERETVREMYNILNEYADQLYGPEVKPKDCNDSGDGSDEDDMEKAMAKETSEMKEARNKERRFQNTDSKAKNCIFIRTTVQDPCQLAHSIFTDIVDKQVQKARYALRMLPISITCKTNMNDIKEAAEKILKPHFETEFGVGLKFTSVCKIRNNQSVSRMTILPTLGKIIQELNPLHKLCHDEPDLVIIVEVIRNVCCMSVVKDYFSFKKYNFHEVLSNKAANGSKSVSSRVEGSEDQGETTKCDKTEEEKDSQSVCTKEKVEESKEDGEKAEPCVVTISLNTGKEEEKEKLNPQKVDTVSDFKATAEECQVSCRSTDIEDVRLPEGKGSNEDKDCTNISESESEPNSDEKVDSCVEGTDVNP